MRKAKYEKNIKNHSLKRRNKNFRTNEEKNDLTV